MEAFVVSARKYRPSKFEDVVGQGHITTTLKNAFKSNQLAHAFLFCGPRGVGKTTNARILAKVVNCLNPTADFEPCNECQSCQSFNSNSSFNIFELDAASNNGVEDIRELVQQVRIPPQGAKYKVYIIDEVHMLTSQAFNAFLKTLEEPPAYAIFILATTEKQKIIPTILSRCQVFDFRRIKTEEIIVYLRTIAADRKVEASEEALHLIAQKADGGMRDALSLFDKMASFCNGNIQVNEVLEQLNILDYEFNFKMTNAMLIEDRTTVLNSLHQILMKGFEGDNVINALAEHFRNLLLCRDTATVNLLDMSDSLRQKFTQQAIQTPVSFLLSSLNILNECDLHYRNSKNKRLHVELCLIKLCYLNRMLAQPAITASPNDNQDKKKTEYPNNATTTIAEEPKNAIPTSTLSQPQPVIPTEKSIPITASKATGSAAVNSSSVSLKGLNNLDKMKEDAQKKIAEAQSLLASQEKKIAPPIEENKPSIVPPIIVEKKKYTPMEKFNEMVNNNPILKDLANELNLEVDF